MFNYVVKYSKIRLSCFVPLFVPPHQLVRSFEPQKTDGCTIHLEKIRNKIRNVIRHGAEMNDDLRDH